MPSYYLAGQETLTNRGCEALVRGISTIIRETQPDAEFLAPSFDITGDSRQWPDSSRNGVRFIPAYRLPKSARLWSRIHRKLPAIRNVWLPASAIPSAVMGQLRDTRAGILTGGDILSLDYGIPSLLKWVGQAENYAATGRPMVLWAGSIGPFSADRFFEKRMVRHLATYADVSVRESATLAYLQGLGLSSVRLVADPAFVMIPEPWDVSGLLPHEAGEGILGFNISPLVKNFRGGGGDSASEMEQAVVRFFHDVMKQTSLSLMLIPHVDTVDGAEWNSDFLYMQRLLKSAALPADRVSLAPRDMNAARVKHLISHCRYFIGARTHSTIAAWSTRVPTISIAYSVKARGLNSDLFGDLRYVLETPKVSQASLWESLQKLRADEDGIIALLDQRIPEWQHRARRAADPLLAFR
jgi:colanic acid/amylovoran biosynthesis protein